MSESTKHTHRIGSPNPYLTGMGVAIYQAFKAAMPEYTTGIVTGLTFSHVQPPEMEIGEEVSENVFFNPDNGAVFVLVPEETKEDKDELLESQIGSQGVIR